MSMRGPAIREDNDANRHAALRQQGDHPSAAQDLVIRMRGHHHRWTRDVGQFEPRRKASLETQKGISKKRPGQRRLPRHT